MLYIGSNVEKGHCSRPRRLLLPPPQEIASTAKNFPVSPWRRIPDDLTGINCIQEALIVDTNICSTARVNKFAEQDWHPGARRTAGTLTAVRKTLLPRAFNYCVLALQNKANVLCNEITLVSSCIIVLTTFIEFLKCRWLLFCVFVNETGNHF